MFRYRGVGVSAHAPGWVRRPRWSLLGSEDLKAPLAHRVEGEHPHGHGQ